MTCIGRRLSSSSVGCTIHVARCLACLEGYSYTQRADFLAVSVPTNQVLNVASCYLLACPRQILLHGQPDLKTHSVALTTITRVCLRACCFRLMVEPSAEKERPASQLDRDDEEKEDEEECPWCKWMKGGGCRSDFQVWLDCVDEVKAQGREDVEKCAEVMGPLWECMERNRDYYGLQLDSLAERKAAAAAPKEDGEGREAAEGPGGSDAGGGSKPEAKAQGS